MLEVWFISMTSKNSSLDKVFSGFSGFCLLDIIYLFWRLFRQDRILYLGCSSLCGTMAISGRCPGRVSLGHKAVITHQQCFSDGSRCRDSSAYGLVVAMILMFVKPFGA